MEKRLYRSRTERILGGVSAGMAEYFNLDIALVRLLWVIVVLVTGIAPGLIAYAVAWIIIPEAPGPGPTRRDGSGGGNGGSRAHGPGAPDAGRNTPPEVEAEELPAEGKASTGDAPPAATASGGGGPASPRAGGDKPSRAEGGRVVAALVLIAVGIFSLINRVIPWFNWDLVWPVALIGVGAYLLLGRGRSR